MKSPRRQFTMGLYLVVAVSLVAPLMRAASGVSPSARPNDNAQQKVEQQFKEMKTHYEAGLKALGAKQYESAVTELKQASALGPTQAVVWAQLAEAYAGLASTKPEADRKPLFLKAVDAYRTAIRLKPGVAGYLNNYAIALGRAGQTDEALAAAEQAVKLDPASAGLYYFNLGAILYNANQDDVALEAFEKVPHASPEFAKAKEEIDDIRLRNPVYKSISRDIQSPAFRSTIRAYLESAKNGFQNLKGKELAKTSDAVAWDSTLNLPGAYCGIMTDMTRNKWTHLSCTFSKSRNKDQLRSDYQQLLAAVRKGLPSTWSVRETGPEPRTGPSTLLEGPENEVFVGINWNGYSYELNFGLGR